MPICAQVHRIEGADRTVESVRSEVSHWSSLFARRPVVGCRAMGDLVIVSFWVEEYVGTNCGTIQDLRCR